MKLVLEGNSVLTVGGMVPSNWARTEDGRLINYNGDCFTIINKDADVETVAYADASDDFFGIPVTMMKLGEKAVLEF